MIHLQTYFINVEVALFQMTYFSKDIQRKNELKPLLINATMFKINISVNLAKLST